MKISELYEQLENAAVNNGLVKRVQFSRVLDTEHGSSLCIDVIAEPLAPQNDSSITISEQNVDEFELDGLANIPSDILKIAVMYAYTPLEQRKDPEPCWYIHPIKTGQYQYLTKTNNDYDLDAKDGGFACQVTFSQSEVNEMKANPNFDGINWDKVLEKAPNDENDC